MATPIVIRSVAQRELLEQIAAGVPHPSLSAEDARAALAAHGGGRLPERVVVDRGARVAARRMKRRGR